MSKNVLSFKKDSGWFLRCGGAALLGRPPPRRNL